MKRLLKKLLIFCIPFVLLIAFFFAFEPYDYWNLKGDEWYMSRSISSMRELILEDPENIILGDSRMANLNTDYIEEISGEKYTNMAYGGATLHENLEQFWYAVNHTKNLKKVVIGISYYTLDGNMYSTRMDEVIEKVENPLLFMSDFGYWVDAFQNAKNKTVDLWADITGNEHAKVHLDDPSTQDDPALTSEQTPEGYREDLFDYAHAILGNIVSHGYSLTGDGMYIDRLVEIAEYCDKHDIELILVMAPCNRAIWDIVIYPNKLDSTIEYYKNALKSVATVYDTEFYNDFAMDDDNFIDGHHLCKEEKLRMARIIFGGEESPYYLKTTPEQYLAGNYTPTDQMSVYPPVPEVVPDDVPPSYDDHSENAR